MPRRKKTYTRPTGLPIAFEEDLTTGFPHISQKDDDRVGWCENCQQTFYWHSPGGVRRDGECPPYRHLMERWEEYEVAITLAGFPAGEALKAKRRGWEHE